MWRMPKPQFLTGRETARFRIAFLFFLVSLTALGQQDTTQSDSTSINPEHVKPVLITEQGDTIPWEILDEILVVSKPTFSDAEARRRYIILKRKVNKVYPYAIMAGDKLDSLNLALDSLDSKRQRKRHIKEYQEFLEERFEPKLKKLTRSEGQILCKLIYRETGKTVYELISEYRSSWKAFWWNAMANWYDISLKKEYDPINDPEDKLIENILQIAFAEGSLKERVPFYPPPLENGEDEPGELDDPNKPMTTEEKDRD